MEYDYPRHINGINLDDYHPTQQAYNSVVYIHKKSLNKIKVDKEKKTKDVKDKKAKKKITKNTKCENCDKCLQCETEGQGNKTDGPLPIDNSLFAQSLQLAKAIVPLIIPCQGVESPVYFTVKATKKPSEKSNQKITLKNNISTNTQTLKRGKSKRLVETYRNVRGRESISVKETISYTSQSDTLDEMQNPSLCCTLSEISEMKSRKRDSRDRPRHNTYNNVVPSESFEALATEFLNPTGDTKIKIHLMNETEKNLLTENIKVPVLNAIQDCISDMNNYKHNAEVTIQKYVKCNSQKFDSILNKLSCIENKLDKYIESEITKAKMIEPHSARQKERPVVDNNLGVRPKAFAEAKQKSPKTAVPMLSTLEQLGEDILEVVDADPLAEIENRQESSGDEYFKEPSLSARKRSRRTTTARLENRERKEVNAGGEEFNRSDNARQGQSVKPERPSRVPARYCWADAAGKS